MYESHDSQRRKMQPTCQNIEGAWDLIIRIAAVRKKRPKRTTYAYEAKNLQGTVMFSGSVICGALASTAASKEALVEAAIKAKKLGFCRILFLCYSNKIVQVCNQNCNPSWNEKTMIYDILNLQQQGVCCKALFAPRAILSLSAIMPKVLLEYLVLVAECIQPWCRSCILLSLVSKKNCNSLHIFVLYYAYKITCSSNEILLFNQYTHVL